MNKTLNPFLWAALGILYGCATMPLSHPQLMRASDLVAQLPPEHRQALVVLPSSRGPTQANIIAFERDGDWWANKFSAMPAVIGRNGFAPAGEKKEGDGRTPSGTFALKRAFGYYPDIDTGLVYRQVSDHDYWVDEPDSPRYNQWVQGTPPAESYEVLKRADDLYSYAAIVEYNSEPIVPGAGSAIFLHVWRNSRTPTAGCIATAPASMKLLLKWLDLSAKPVIILGD